MGGLSGKAGSSGRSLGDGPVGSRTVAACERIRARAAGLQPPAGDFGAPGDVAGGAAYPASAAFATGAVLTVGGGWTAR